MIKTTNIITIKSNLSNFLQQNYYCPNKLDNKPKFCAINRFFCKYCFLNNTKSSQNEKYNIISLSDYAKSFSLNT